MFCPGAVITVTSWWEELHRWMYLYEVLQIMVHYEPTWQKLNMQARLSCSLFPLCLWNWEQWGHWPRLASLLCEHSACAHLWVRLVSSDLLQRKIEVWSAIYPWHQKRFLLWYPELLDIVYCLVCMIASKSVPHEQGSHLYLATPENLAYQHHSGCIVRWSDCLRVA